MKDGWLEPQIYLVRHGHHPEGFRGGWSQHSLSHLGRVQASRLADRLLSEDARVDTLISSDLPRAKETAEILGSALNIPLSLTGEWREVNNGELAGMPNDQVEARYPGLYWSSLEMNQAYPGGESPAQFRSRIEGAFRSLCELIEKGCVGPRVMVVTHGGPIRVVLSLVSGILWSNKGPQQRLQETGISCLVRAGNVWKITCQDDARHLSGVSVHRLSNPGGEEVDAIIHPLTTRDVERFLAWRGEAQSPSPHGENTGLNLGGRHARNSGSSLTPGISPHNVSDGDDSRKPVRMLYTASQYFPELRSQRLKMTARQMPWAMQWTRPMRIFR